MVVLRGGGGAVSYEPGTSVLVEPPLLRKGELARSRTMSVGYMGTLLRKRTALARTLRVGLQ
jgi:hypothetical protein